MKPTKYAIAFPADLLQKLKDRHARTYPEHRLSFNAWIVARLQGADLR